MNNLTAKFQNFVTFTTLKEPSDNDALLLAQWATSRANTGVLYLYVCWDSDVGNLDPNNTQIISEQLQAENVGATCVAYPDFKMASFIMGVTASIAWDQANSTITYAFKHLSGVGATVENTSQANALDGHKVNYMGNFATRNDNFILSYNGSMLGEWDWIDTYLNAVWLNNALQVAIMAGLNQSPRVPYTDEGYALVRAWCMDPINRALKCGIIDPGVTLSESQKAELQREAGRDISGELRTDGYVLQVDDASPAVRQQRETPSCSLWYCYGSSIHRIDLASTVVV
jgi:hypothetical protein